MRKISLFTLFLLVVLPAYAQPRFPRASPKASLNQTVGLTDITITYSRPGVKGRTIWGSLVPYDQVWRTGANEATTISFSDEVMINGQKLAKGMYSLHTIPGRDQWTIIFNKVADQWGSYSYDQAQDVLRVSAKPEKADYREWMSFEIPEMTTDTAKVVLRWENVAVPFTVDTQTTERALKDVEKAIASVDEDRWSIPYRAADFAFQAGRMDEAQKYLDLALKEKQNAATLWLKARMLQKQGRTADALRNAEMAIATATPEQKVFAGEIRRLSDLWRK